ncbi:hypothetical protein EVAR_66123_1 [Eumeta japonica]|uniref:Uncharacterized protein n=1 Tax=Eumeta variegata TaxID=151549 RepID=A0A4C1ZQ34_EUMVA|nr:hypothetical protein EVAR_66123_1 [Eumeta japonica]
MLLEQAVRCLNIYADSLADMLKSPARGGLRLVAAEGRTRCAMGHTIDSDPVSAFVFTPGPVFNFGSGVALDSDPGSIEDT